MCKNIQKIKINRLPIELYKFLKLENIVQSGGEAKMAISQGYVMVNGQVETRKGKKLAAGDIVEIQDNDMKFILE